jgi:polysaccharide export outer membrane protein
MALFIVVSAILVSPCLSWAAPLASPEAEVADRSGADIPAYKLGSGDRIRLLTFGEADLTGEFEVTGAGTVDLPLIGEIHAAGLTTAEFSAAVEAALRKGFLVNPQVSVAILNYRPFYILGEVAKPGEYPFTSGLTVRNAVATANGFTYRADTKHVYIKRANDTRERRYDLTTSTVVAPGDTIRIGERYF